ncbi:Membrane-bound lytic murein transglycosylase D precursor [Myxococcus hansupus]|uniref:Membrane-bound lytic murein transglycosylase D n=1 Tax=Pseudomyxococcus hansupus TaxID=1297742 RepID=A0A0H4X1K6_9BACT|nr:LysM domain-containing protein [Myxococcus hansupus]AKQ69541.1 Membrane-bound lytic murein transglycosylase D precursor [Myxococcus hansupus]
MSGSSTSYRIRQGDTLTSIARRNNTTVDALARANNIRDPDRIITGKTLTIPGARDGFDAAANAPRPMPRPEGLQTGGSQRRDSFEAGTSQAGMAQGVTPAGTASVSGTQNGYRNIDLNAFRQGGTNSESAIVIGTSEGNRTPNGGFTASYGGHTDPGNAKHNRGSFSYQGTGANSPAEADALWNRELGRVTPQYQAAAQRAGLDPNNALLASTFYDLHTQSPRAAQNFINRELPRLAQDPRGVTPEALVDARVNAFRNDAGELRAAGFDHNETRLRADQTRRETALVRALDARGYRDGGNTSATPAEVPIPRPRPENLTSGTTALPAEVPIPRPRPENLTSGTTALPAEVPIPRPRPENLTSGTTTAAESATPTDFNDTAVIAPAGDRPAVQTGAKWISQYDGSQVERAGDVACFRAVQAMAAQSGVTVTGPGNRIQVATGDATGGGVTVDRAAAQRGLNYIDSQLDAGKPVGVGVNHRPGQNSDNVDGITDHFVLITGRGVDEQGRTYYTFHDPATNHRDRGADTNPNNRFYVDQDSGKMYREGPTTGPVALRHFEVTMVRPNA